MPAPQATLMKQAARLKFTSFSLKAPPNWQQPQGEAADHFDQAFKPEEKTTSPGMPPLFQPASLNKYHTDSQKMLIAKIGAFIDQTCDAICSAWAQWQATATMTGVMINAVSASLGQVVGIPWTPLIMMSGAKSTPMQLKYTTVIANVVGMAWQTYTATIKVPGLPWYPAFAAFPSPVAPPMPNVPVPIAALTQVTTSLSAALLKQQMVGQLADPAAPFHGQLFEAICDAFDKMFMAWQLSTMVTQVMGTGPVPTFAPPYVPAGPVVGGVGNMIPGGFT
jgi:hypothetical protein